MQSLRFYQLPLVVKIAVGVVFNNAWWSIAKTYTKTQVKATEAMLLISKAERILANDS